MTSRCVIYDGDCYFALLHDGKNGGLEQARLDQQGQPDWATAQLVDFLRLSPRRELYLRTIVGMLIALEWMQRER
jgi:hypothetical protein